MQMSLYNFKKDKNMLSHYNKEELQARPFLQYCFSKMYTYALNFMAKTLRLIM